MLAIDVIQNKPNATINGADQLDLTVSSVAEQGIANIFFTNVIPCPVELEMRPDLMSYYFLNDQNKMGMMLKLNAISNPYSLQAGDIIFIPSLDCVNSLLADNQTVSSGPSVRDSFRKQLAARVSTISGARKNYLDARNNQSVSSPLPPNVSNGAAQQFKIENGRLILGSNIGKSRTNTITSSASQKNILGS